MDIKKYIGEATEYDKKQEVERRKVKSWLKSVSAFANGAGGCLIFGVSYVHLNYYMGDGVLETFMRIGKESVVADATEHKRLVLRGRNASFDARLSDELIENFLFERLRGRFYAWNNVGFDSRSSQNVCCRRFTPTVHSLR